MFQFKDQDRNLMPPPGAPSRHSHKSHKHSVSKESLHSEDKKLRYRIIDPYSLAHSLSLLCVIRSKFQSLVIFYWHCDPVLTSDWLYHGVV